MWPIGYIAGSPFSPLQLELEIPERNWRDAFEDLIALETCGQMISRESREKQAEVAVRLARQEAHVAISRSNELLARGSKYMSILQRSRKFAARQNHIGLVSHIDKEALLERMKSQKLIDLSQTLISQLDEIEQAGKPKVSSETMGMGHWITSLISSGALPAWESRLYDSANGQLWSFNKKTAPHESTELVDDQAGLDVTDGELASRFHRGIPLQLAYPVWSTKNGAYPEFVQFPNVNPDDGSVVGYTSFKFPPLRHSICSQFTRVDRTRLPSGLFSTRVLIRNQFTDGRTEEKEIVDDVGKVLEEVKEAIMAMENKAHGLMLAWRDKRNEDTNAIIMELECLRKTIEMERQASAYVLKPYLNSGPQRSSHAVMDSLCHYSFSRPRNKICKVSRADRRPLVIVFPARAVDVLCWLLLSRTSPIDEWRCSQFLLGLLAFAFLNIKLNLRYSDLLYSGIC